MMKRMRKFILTMMKTKILPEVQMAKRSKKLNRSRKKMTK
jgi:hypothetical protein